MIRYAVVKGSPDTGERCTVILYVDGVEAVWYDGYFNPRKRIWKLYINHSEIAAPVQPKIIIQERDVHYDVRPTVFTKPVQKPAGRSVPAKITMDQIKL